MLEILSKIYQIFLSWILESRYAKVLIFCENNAGEEKRSDEYCLFIIKVCHNEGGRKPSTSEPTRLVIEHFSTDLIEVQKAQKNFFSKIDQFYL